jgi:hypothetical protein
MTLWPDRRRLLWFHQLQPVDVRAPHRGLWAPCCIDARSSPRGCSPTKPASSFAVGLRRNADGGLFNPKTQAAWPGNPSPTRRPGVPGRAACRADHGDVDFSWKGGRAGSLISAATPVRVRGRRAARAVSGALLNRSLSARRIVELTFRASSTETPGRLFPRALEAWDQNKRHRGIQARAGAALRALDLALGAPRRLPRRRRKRSARRTRRSHRDPQGDAGAEGDGTRCQGGARAVIAAANDGSWRC